MKKLTYEEVVQIFQRRNCQLVSKYYVNSRMKLQFICPKGHLSATYLSSFKRSPCGCGICKSIGNAENKRKYTYEIVKKSFINRGFTLLSTSYKNTTLKLYYICPNRHYGCTSYANFVKGVGCAKCTHIARGKSSRLSYEKVKSIIESENYQLISAEYVGTNQKLQIKCPKNHICHMAFANFKSGNRCKICHLESSRGANHPRWNPNLTDEERVVDRDTPENWEFIKRVYKRDGYTCQVCGKKSNIAAHHLSSWNSDKNNRYNPDNAVTLCNEKETGCHKIFHKIYGQGNNTKEQFIEFKNSILLGYA